MTNPWLSGDAARGSAYDRRFAALAESGVDVHGEVAMLERLGVGSVLDAGCGTGRIAVELARRGHDVVGVDLDPEMLAAARSKDAPVTWVLADLLTVDLGRAFDAVVAAGNVMIFLTPGTEPGVIENLARHLRPAGRLIAGFSVRAGGLDLAGYDALAAAAGLSLESRFATWEGAPFTGGDYAVSVHRHTDRAAQNWRSPSDAARSASR